MLNSFPVAVLIGVLTGALAGIGVGGGSLLILWLTTVLAIPQEEARVINLIFFIFCAGAVSLIRIGKGQLRLRRLIPAILSGAVAALLFSILWKHLDHAWLRKGFGILLIATGLRELFYRPAKFK